jgi:hypothetical protein
MYIICLSNSDITSLMSHKDSHNATIAYFEDKLNIKIEQFIWLGDKSFLVF